MTSGHVLFVGEDICARVNVLHHVGYRVTTCACEADALRQSLARGAVDAILFQCMPEPPSRMLLGTCRLLTNAPIILFADRESPFQRSDFDAVVPNLCEPREWLSRVGEAITAWRDPERAKPPQAAAASEASSGIAWKTGSEL